MERKQKKHLRFSAKRDYVLRLLVRAGLVSAETLTNILLALPQIGAAMMAGKSESLKNLQALPESSFSVDFTSPKAIYDLLARLDHDGLIQETDGGFKIMRRGLKYISSFLKLPKWGKSYTPVKSRSLTMIIFDIPEKKRGIRAWLRETLRKMKFVPLQQSVWIGRTGVPLEFIHDIKNYDIQPYLHILKVSKKGSVSSVIKNLLG